MVLKLPPPADGDVMLLRREITEIPVLSNTIQQVTIRLRPNLVKNFILHLEAVVEVGPGGANLNPDQPYRFIQNITIYTPRGEVLKNIDGRMINFLNNFEYGTAEYSTFAALVPDESNVFYADLLIPFENHTANIKAGVDREDTILNLNEFTELYVSILWGDAATIFDAAMTEQVITCTLIALEREPLSTSDELEPRKKLIDQSFENFIKSDELQILLPENTLIKTILIMVQNDSKVRTADWLLRARIEDNDHAHVIRSLTGDQIQSQNKSYYGIEAGQQVGLYVLEFDQLRDLTTLYNTHGINYPKLILDFDPTVAWEYEKADILIRQVTTPPALTI